MKSCGILFAWQITPIKNIHLMLLKNKRNSLMHKNILYSLFSLLPTGHDNHLRDIFPGENISSFDILLYKVIKNTYVYNVIKNTYVY